jgi:hypothetical protein
VGIEGAYQTVGTAAIIFAPRRWWRILLRTARSAPKLYQKQDHQKNPPRNTEAQRFDSREHLQGRSHYSRCQMDKQCWFTNLSNRRSGGNTPPLGAMQKHEEMNTDKTVHIAPSPCRSLSSLSVSSTLCLPVLVLVWCVVSTGKGTDKTGMVREGRGGTLCLCQLTDSREKNYPKLA